MSLQLIKDGNGNNTGVFVPMTDWDRLAEKHQDLQELLPLKQTPKRKLSELAGSLSKETVEAMQQYVEQGRNEWDENQKTKS